MDSIWLKTAEKPHFDTLNENKKTDVLIIGGGIAGILCAYKLKNAGVDCMLIKQYSHTNRKRIEKSYLLYPFFLAKADLICYVALFFTPIVIAAIFIRKKFCILLRIG